MYCGHGSSSVVRSPMWQGLRPICYFNEFLFTQVLTHDKIQHINGWEHNAMVYRFCVRPTSMRRFLKTVQSDHETWSIWCHVGHHVNFSSISHSHTPWSLECSVKRTWTGSFTFSTNESAWSVMVTGSQSRVWWPLVDLWDCAVVWLAWHHLPRFQVKDYGNFKFHQHTYYSRTCLKQYCLIQ